MHAELPDRNSGSGWPRGAPGSGAGCRALPPPGPHTSPPPPFSPALTPICSSLLCVGQMFLQMLASPPLLTLGLEIQTLTDWEFTPWRGEGTL